ncbi:hypothetical protein BpHYR1_041576 [Brachionus plicatilis]|uniref:Uncharacterized protein n=1 Tax=Brachionus plicatilis TaxID=10195 RepID=A0A3M7SRQ3_BRAPC|nr:hypothetical protein BpHYR1_041576 [Brachionus plicatilis]
MIAAAAGLDSSRSSSIVLAVDLCIACFGSDCSFGLCGIFVSCLKIELSKLSDKRIIFSSFKKTNIKNNFKRSLRLEVLKEKD